MICGMAIAPLIYFVTASMKKPILFAVFMLAILIFNLYLIIKQYDQNKTYQFSTKHILYPLFFIFIIIILLHIGYFTDMLYLDNGGFLLRTSFYTESIFHLGIVNQLIEKIPAMFPYLSGNPMAYHIDMHLMSVVISKFSTIDTMTSTYYFSTFLFLLRGTCSFGRNWWGIAVGWGHGVYELRADCPYSCPYLWRARAPAPIMPVSSPSVAKHISILSSFLMVQTW